MVSQNETRVGENIRYLRKERGLSQEVLAYKAGINSSYLGQVERGQKSPTIDCLDKISKALGTSLSELVGNVAPAAIPAAQTTLAKIYYQLHDRPEEEQEAVYELIKLFLRFKEQK